MTVDSPTKAYVCQRDLSKITMNTKLLTYIMIKDTADACMRILSITYIAFPTRENKKYKQEIQKKKGTMCVPVTDTYLQSNLS